jgi:hypothetical protein
MAGVEKKWEIFEKKACKMGGGVYNHTYTSA